jgi:outer membrane lipoprotein SlyB
VVEHIEADAIVSSDRNTRMFVMKIVATLFAVALLSLAAQSADAKGCLKGAVVGGVAGHYAGHHGVLGAAAGCLYGRHRAKEQAKQQTQGAPPAAQDKM